MNSWALPSVRINYQVLIVDDHPLYRAALRGAVAAACPDSEFFEAASIAGLFDELERHARPDLLLLDLNLPGAYGFSALAHLRGARPELPIIVVSASDDARTVRQALAFGAQGFVSKGRCRHHRQRCAGGVARRDRVAARAGTRRGARRRCRRARYRAAPGATHPAAVPVFGLLCAGRLNKQIAHELQIMEATVKAHMTAILRKLGACNRTQAALLASRLARDPDEIRPLPREPTEQPPLPAASTPPRPALPW